MRMDYRPENINELLILRKNANSTAPVDCMNRVGCMNILDRIDHTTSMDRRPSSLLQRFMLPILMCALLSCVQDAARKAGVQMQLILLHQRRLPSNRPMT